MSFSFLANIFFPPLCLGCHRHIRSGVICDACFGAIAVHDAIMCGKCNTNLPKNAIEAACHPDFPFILGAAASYEDRALKAMVQHLKFHFSEETAKPMARLLATYIARSGIDLTGFIIIPIPLSDRRRRARGFNQSELIARALADIIKLPIDTTSLIRVKHAKPQSETTSAAERKKNVRDAYAVNPTSTPERLQDKFIFLVDDVSTSGSTFFEASLPLKAAGAARIIALAVAKPSKNNVLK